MSGEWAFLLDENISSQLTDYLRKEGHTAVHVTDVLFEGADDAADVLPHARENDPIVVTSDVTDFDTLPPEEHCGVLLVYDQTATALQLAEGILDLISAFGSRDNCRDVYPLDTVLAEAHP